MRGRHLESRLHARQNQHEQALAAARRALDADGHHLATLKLLARIHFLRGEHDQARRLVTRAMELERSARRYPQGSRSWRAAFARSWCTTRRRVPSLDADEDRQWRDWAEAYLRSGAHTDGRTG